MIDKCPDNWDFDIELLKSSIINEWLDDFITLMEEEKIILIHYMQQKIDNSDTTQCSTENIFGLTDDEITRIALS
jgi:hypothetical protein